MLSDGLVDELHLFVYPVSLGQGRRLLGDDPRATKFVLANCASFTSGVVYLNYQAAE
jgi:dihydrofolate reductase